MIPLYLTSQIRAIDDYAISKMGIPGIVLMENASREIHGIIKSGTGSSIKKIAFVCGKGNNGGDGFAAARHFANDGYNVIVIYLGSEKDMSKDCKFNFSVLKKESKILDNLTIRKYHSNSSLALLKKCDVIVEALLGSGVTGKIREPYLSIVRYLNKLNAYKVAVDIPTGVNSESGFAEEAFKANLTITLGELKKGLFIGEGFVYSGDVEKGRIGIPDILYNKFNPADFLVEPEDCLGGLPKKRKNIHKYSAGKVLTIAGSGSLPGAAVLTAKAVLKIGAGASILSFPKSVRNLIQKKLGEVVVHSYEDDGAEFLQEENLPMLKEKIRWADIVAVGPGLGRDPKTQQAVLSLMKNFRPKKMVIDADALFALGRNRYKKLNLKNCVLTPHHGEFSTLLGIDSIELRRDLLKYGRSFAKRTKAYLVLKGAPTITFTPAGDALINTTGNPALAKFGTGDVLTGFIAGLISQSVSIEQAVVSAVYLHGLAADLLSYKNTEYALLASDIINYLPDSIKFLRNSFV